MGFEVHRYTTGNPFRKVRSSIRITKLVPNMVPKPRPQLLHRRPHLWVYSEPFHSGTQIEFRQALPIIPVPTGHNMDPPQDIFIVSQVAATTSRGMTIGESRI